MLPLNWAGWHQLVLRVWSDTTMNGLISKKPIKKSKPKTVIRYCVNCRNHGLKKIISGHKSSCLFRECCCFLCCLTERARTVSLQERKLHREIDRAHKQAEEPPKIIKDEPPSPPEEISDESDENSFPYDIRAEEEMGFDVLCCADSKINLNEIDPAMEFVNWINLWPENSRIKLCVKITSTRRYSLKIRSFQLPYREDNFYINVIKLETMKRKFVIYLKKENHKRKLKQIEKLKRDPSFSLISVKKIQTSSSTYHQLHPLSRIPVQLDISLQWSSKFSSCLTLNKCKYFCNQSLVIHIILRE